MASFSFRAFRAFAFVAAKEQSLHSFVGEVSLFPFDLNDVPGMGVPLPILPKEIPPGEEGGDIDIASISRDLDLERPPTIRPEMAVDCPECD